MNYQHEDWIQLTKDIVVQKSHISSIEFETLGGLGATYSFHILDGTRYILGADAAAAPLKELGLWLDKDKKYEAGI